MKKIMMLILTIVAAGILIADIHDIVIEGGTYTIEENDTLRVYVNAYNLTEEMKVIAYQFDSYYNPEYLEYVGHEAGDLFENAVLMANGETAGIIKVGCAHWLPETGDGTLIELIFVAKKIGESTLQFDEFKMNSDLMEQVYDADIKIIGSQKAKK